MSFEMDNGQSFTFSETAEQRYIHFMNCETVLSRILMRYGDLAYVMSLLYFVKLRLEDSTSGFHYYEMNILSLI